MFFSLRNRLFLIFTILLTIPFLVLSILIPAWLTESIKDQTRELSVEVMDQYSLYIESIATQAEDIGKQVLLNELTQDWLRVNGNPDATVGEKFLAETNLESQLAAMMINNSNSMSINVFLSDGATVWGEGLGWTSEKWYSEYLNDERIYTSAHLDSFQQSTEMINQQVNSFLVPLFDLNTMMNGGVIKVSFPTYILENALDNQAVVQTGYTYLVDSNAEKVLSQQIPSEKTDLSETIGAINLSDLEKGMIERVEEGEKFLIFYQKLPFADWVLINEVAESALFSEVDDLQRTLLFISFGIFILTMIASFIFSSTIIRPVSGLTKAMSFIERGDFKGAKSALPSVRSGRDEVGYLIHAADHTIDQLNRMIETEYKANLRRKDAEYNALLLQINPHFLNNTLEIIGSLALQEKNREVMNVSVALGKMLRYSLKTEHTEVPLAEELTYMKSYTDILKIRYGEQLKVTINDDSSALGLLVPKFTLQPLIENAVKYSFTQKHHAEIEISITDQNHSVIVAVSDKGEGMTEDLITNLKDFEESDVLKSKGYSIGLRNVIGRLKLYFGDRFSYDIKSKPGIGTEMYLYFYTNEGVENDEDHDRRR
ncbi:hypothetical protein JMA_09400 [Jeotgalibacillus malaysiensis]|uniref:HAMP domain-containing protein n=1 Tax=Jeotgalibacillus malaysiensis TaxID=1508404 RepID=A0A0B5ANL0_9BACL|nr:sensor histidine kinase [Jeotgalibacillus malaysiensis]AJD90257.1 hypothetical protein JMA_09400 [Jeotgalibacillus malaysiensis]